MAPTADSTPFLCSCAKKRGGAPKKRAYGCRHGRCSVPPASPTDSKPQHHSRLRQADFARPIYPPCTSQLDAPICPVGAYAQMGEAGGPTKVMWRLQSAFLWRLDTVSLGKHQRNGVERQDRPSTTSQRNGAPVQSPDKHQSPAKVGRGTSRLPTGSAHANGGASSVKRRFSLAARHRFFGQAPKKWGRKAGQAIDPHPA